jgi:hypothetical protein
MASFHRDQHVFDVVVVVVVAVVGVTLLIVVVQGNCHSEPGWPVASPLYALIGTLKSEDEDEGGDEEGEDDRKLPLLPFQLTTNCRRWRRSSLLYLPKALKCSSA